MQYICRYYEQYPERLYQKHEEYAPLFTYNANESDINGLIIVTIVTMLLIENSYFVHFFYLYLEKCQQIRVPSQWIHNARSNRHSPQIGYGTLVLLWATILNFLHVMGVMFGYGIMSPYFIDDIKLMVVMTNLVYIVGFINTIPFMLGILFFIDAIERHGFLAIIRALCGMCVCFKCTNWVSWSHPY